MTKSGDEGDVPPPDVEVFIVNGDGRSTPRQAPFRGRPPMGIGRRIGIALGIVAVFAFGVILGRSSNTVQPGVATPAVTAPISPTGQSSLTTPPSTSRERSSTPTGSPSETSAAPTTPLDKATESWPLVPAACGQSVPKPLIEGAKPFTAEVGMRLVTGGDPAPVNLADGVVGPVLFEPDTATYIADLALAGNETVLLVKPCDGTETDLVVRVTSDGDVTDVALPDDLRRVALVRGGKRVWVAVSAGSYGYSPVTLVAADGSGDTVTLSDGFEPLSARGQQIVSQYGFGGMSRSSFRIFDIVSGKIDSQFGDPPTLGGSVATNAKASGDYIIAAPWVCESTCEVTRYKISAGAKHSAALEPASDRILSTGSAAIKPDGTVAAIALYNQPLPPAPFLPYQQVTDGGQGVTRVGLLNLDNGTIRALPGLALGAGDPRLAFSPDGKWLVVAVGAGYKTRVLLYTADGDGPYDPRIDVPGLVLSPALAITGPS